MQERSGKARERLVWRVRQGCEIPAEGGGSALAAGEEMVETDPRFERWRSSLVSSWEPVSETRAIARMASPSTAPAPVPGGKVKPE